MPDRWGDGVWTALLETRERLAAILPGLFVLVVLLGLGVLLGVITKVVLERGARAFGFDRVMERWGVAASLRRSGVQRAPSGVLGLLAFWAIFLFFASAGVDAVALPGAHSATALLLAFLPPLFAALLILVAGWLLANFLGQTILLAAVNARLPEARLLARVAAWPAPPRASAITPASFRLETGEVEEDVADAAASQPRVSEFVRAVAARDGCGGRRGRVVDEDGVAFQADEDEQVAGRGGDGGAAELAGRVAHGGDDRNPALETPARRAPVGEAQQIAGHAARAGGADGGGPDAVDVERGMEHLGGERGRRRGAAPVTEHHRDARRRAEARAERRVGFHLTERGHLEPRGGALGETEIGRRGVGRRERDDPARARGRPHAHAQPYGIHRGRGSEHIHVTRERRRGRRQRRELRGADRRAGGPRRPLAVGECRNLETERERRVRERRERREQVRGRPPRRPRRQHQQRVGAIARGDRRRIDAAQAGRRDRAFERPRLDSGGGQEQVGRHHASEVGKEVPSRLVKMPVKRAPTRTRSPGTALATSPRRFRANPYGRGPE